MSLNLPPHMLDMFRAGLDLEGKTTTAQLLQYPFSQPTFFSQQHFGDLVFPDNNHPGSWEEHVASYLVARAPVLQQRLDMVKGDLGECRCWLMAGRAGNQGAQNPTPAGGTYTCTVCWCCVGEAHCYVHCPH
jgi:hypothetical protein